MFAKLSAEKGSSDDYPRLKKRKAREQRKWNFLNFYNEPINLPQFFLCKVHLAESSQHLFVTLTLNTASYLMVIAFCEGKKRKNNLL